MNFVQQLAGFWLLLCLFLPTQVAAKNQNQGAKAKGNLKVVYAINAGSHEHTDTNGIHYAADTLRVGTASDYGNHLIMIGRVPEHDEILYRTERYHTATFGYDIPLDGDGDYALILKFCEVYFNEPNAKVFDVVLNHEHKIVAQLDIFHQVGRGTAYDEYVFFTVADGRLYYKDEVSDIFNNMIRLEFIKGPRDNPKINAFALLKGNVENVPRLPPLMLDERINKPLKQNAEAAANAVDEYDEDDEEDELQKPQLMEQYNDEKLHKKVERSIDDADDDLNYEDGARRARKTSGPRLASPYTVDDSSSYMLPVFIAIGAFIPLLFCLCKL